MNGLKYSNEDYPIDFVIAWVDGNDPKWQEEKSKYQLEMTDLVKQDSRTIRFSDLGTLKYWFRGVEKYAPWVNKVYFVTWGHVPEWLDTNNPKLRIVKHEEYIPKEYLPTFSSHTIELNFHRIPDLSEHFVYFNDDMFITAPVTKEDFFKNGLPKDIAAIHAKWFVSGKTPDYVQIQDTAIINKHFEKNAVIKKDLFKWFNIKYGLLNFRTLSLIPWPHFITLYTRHLPTSNLKTTFEDVWEAEHEILDTTCKHRIRSYLDVNQWVFQFWQICKGEFFPARVKDGHGFVVGETKAQNENAFNAIISNRYKLICVGEGDDMINYYDLCAGLANSFNKILPEKCSFEK